MAKPTNKDKSIEIDESILDETPPNINEPQDKEEEIDTNPEIEEKKEDDTKIVYSNREEEVEEDKKDSEQPRQKAQSIQESEEEKDKRYKAQQTEAQIQAARTRALSQKVDEASKIPEPSVEELTAFVAAEGVAWDDLTPFEQSMAKKTYIADKRFAIVNDAVQTTKKIDEWTNTVDEFIDTTDGKPEYIELSGHEAEFRKFATQESHRGTPMEVLLPAFLHNLIKEPKKRGSLFEHGGGGEKVDASGKISTEELARLRTGTQDDQMKYRTIMKSGKSKIDEDL